MCAPAPTASASASRGFAVGICTVCALVLFVAGSTLTGSAAGSRIGEPAVAEAATTARRLEERVGTPSAVVVDAAPAAREARAAPAAEATPSKLPTTKPSAAARSATPAAARCVDTVADCVHWAKRGECTRNDRYMKAACPKSCGQCTTGAADESARRTARPADGSDAPRPDKMKACPIWAANGECTRNPKYMLESCPNACAAHRPTTHDES